jgi:hypothetical protein
MSLSTSRVSGPGGRGRGGGSTHAGSRFAFFLHAPSHTHTMDAAVPPTVQPVAQSTEMGEEAAALRADIAAHEAALHAAAAALREEYAALIAAAAARDTAAAARAEALREEYAALIAAAAARAEALREEYAARDTAAAARDTAAAAREAALYTRISSRIAAVIESSRAPSPSSTTVGDRALHALSVMKRIFHLQPPPDGASDDEKAPIATPEDLRRLLAACTWRSDLVAAVTPLLRAARGLDALPEPSPADPCPLVLVNSEGVAWLDALSAPQPAGHLKRPDLFVTWAPFWSGLQDPDRGAVGRLASRALQLDGCVREVYAATLGVSEPHSGDFGQLVDCHSRLPGNVDGEPTTTRGMLFNASVFWLYESVSAHPVTLTMGSWGAPGSRAAVRAFFSAAPVPSVVPLLRFMCRKLGVVPRRIAATDAQPAAAAAADGAAAPRPSSAFLGAGASGQVFCVARPPAAGDAEVAAAAAAAEELLYALKVSSTSLVEELTYEFETLARAFEAGAPVVPVVAGSLHFLLIGVEGVYHGGGFLLRDVCARTHVDSRARCVAAFAALHALHARGFAHGDARLPNLVTRGHGAGAELVWIDMRKGFAGDKGTPDLIRYAQTVDGRSLAASVLGIGREGVFPGPVSTALEGVPGGGSAAYDTLSAAVWEATSLWA